MPRRSASPGCGSNAPSSAASSSASGWYGSAQWLHRVATHWILGIRPCADGLRVDPAIPASWPGYTVTRKFRNAEYVIDVRNPEHVSQGVKAVTVDGRRLAGTLIPVFAVMMARGLGR